MHSEYTGVIIRAQLPNSQLAASTADNRLRSGRWQRLQRGVYAPFSGEPAPVERIWAALARAGSGATLSHWSAAERHGLTDRPSPKIHVTVPADRNPVKSGEIPGVVIHRSNSISRARHPTMSPPCTGVEETVLDLIQASATFDEAYAWICRAIGRRRTTTARIRHALDARPKFRWRRETELALSEAGQGALSFLELRYVRGVERPHGIPAAKRQARIRQQAGTRYLDNFYEEYRACVEVDGTAAHPVDEQWRDKRRDRWNSVHEKIETIRIGFLDLRDRRSQCETAADVVKWLNGRGPRVGHPCTRPGCPVGVNP
jgi:hypothetical protein